MLQYEDLIHLGLMRQLKIVKTFVRAGNRVICLAALSYMVSSNLAALAVLKNFYLCLEDDNKLKNSLFIVGFVGVVRRKWRHHQKQLLSCDRHLL